VVKVPNASGYSATLNDSTFGIDTPFGGFNIPLYQSPTGMVRSNQFAGRRPPEWNPSPSDWVNNFMQGINTLGRTTRQFFGNWGTPYRVGMGEVQRYGNLPPTIAQTTTPTNLTGQLATGRTHPNLIRPGSEPQPFAPTTAAAGETTGGNYQENLPYGKSYNYSVNTGEIPNPGSAAAVKYGDEATYNLARAMVDGYGYDYGNYLSWAAENNIQQPASYYSWKSTQGVTHSGQSSQFWEYMQGLSIGKGGGQNLREKLEQKGKMKNIKKYNKKWREARGLEPYEFPEQETGQATQSYATGGGGSRYYSAPASMGLVTWRT
jgi:hypothetical protein